MTKQRDKNFAKKHGNNFTPNISVKNEIQTRTKKRGLSCAVAFDIAKTLNVSAAEVGKNADLLNEELIKCQLGLFGYATQKRVKPIDKLDPELKDAILANLENGKLACKQAWVIASRFNIPKLTVGCACETVNVKIKPCQLGAF